VRSRLNIVPLLAIANTALLLAAAGVGWDMTRRYNELVYGFNASNAQKVVDFAVADLAWHEYAQVVSDLGRNIAQGEALRKIFGGNDGMAQAVLADEFGRGAISSGQVRVVGLSAYDGEMKPLGEAWKGKSEVVPANVIDVIAKREGIDRVKIITRIWMNGDEPRLSVFVPVGGLRLLGYVGVHADPLPALATLDQRLGMTVEIATSDGRRLLASDNFKIPEGAAVHENTLVVRGPEEQPLAVLKVRQDVTELTHSLDAAAFASLTLFILICGAIAIGSLAFVSNYIRQVKEREAAAQAELDQQRREKSEADEARQRAEREADAIRRAELLRLADTFEANVKSVVDFVSSASIETAANAESLADAAERAIQLAEAAADASNQAFENVHSVVNTSEDLSDSAAEITRQVTRSSNIASKAVTEAGETNDVVSGLAAMAQ
jgi:methyl-accepting chemotaxis protein